MNEIVKADERVRSSKSVNVSRGCAVSMLSLDKSLTFIAEDESFPFLSQGAYGWKFQQRNSPRD